jgi:hypothetical protein
MQGSIRTLVGFLVVFGAVGGIETDGPLFLCTALALVGLAVMASGVAALKSVQ